LTVTNSSALEGALASHSDAVNTLFTDSSDGLIARLDSYITKVTGTGGLIPNMTDSLNNDSKSIDQQIARLKAQLDAERTRLTNEFVAMELAQSQIQSQAAAFNNAFGTSSNSNNKA
jgi:flagellar capping protein FliD